MDLLYWDFVEGWDLGLGSWLVKLIIDYWIGWDFFYRLFWDWWSCWVWDFSAAAEPEPEPEPTYIPSLLRFQGFNLDERARLKQR